MADQQNSAPDNREDIMKSASKSGHDVKKLRQYIKALKGLQKGLKTESDQYKALEKDAKRLEIAVSRLIKSKTQLAKVADTLTSKLGSSGAGGGITQFGTAAVNASTSVNKLDGSMNVLGKSTNMAASTFAGWVSAVQLAIAVVVKLADELDKAQIKQANLQRAFGAGNISIRESFNAIATGWKIAGAAGAEAAPKLNAAIRAARGQSGGDLMKEMGGTQGATFKKLLKYDVAAPVDMADKIKTLAEVFNIRTSGGINEQIDYLLNTIIESGLPMERYTGLIVELATQFADVGVTITDSARAFKLFEASVDSGAMTMGLQMKMINLATTQQLTAGGFQGRVITAAFAQDMSANMDPQTIAALDKAAGALYGGKKFTDISAYEASNVLADRSVTSEGLYVKAMEGSYKKLMQIEKASGWGAAEQTAQAIGIPSWREFKKIGPELAAGGAITEEKLREIMMTEGDKMLEASKGMLTASDGMTDAMELAEDNARLNQQWYSEWRAFWAHTTGLIVEALGGETVGDVIETGFIATYGQLIAGPAALPMSWALKQTGLWKEATESSEMGKTQAHKTPGTPLIPGEDELNVEVMEGKSVQIKVQLVDTPTGEKVGGTLGK
ncbi:hypothetical protein LCGC14_0959460 [marine sediment metagenome]|uniref:Uncharacterized protein n=1 Tax=marine sediment metagenome TaxID=412755 RepID=A0A0F9RLB9_9ZZZZ